jgi:hypothetical protein
LNHIQEEAKRAREARILTTHDRFVDVMEVSSLMRRLPCLIELRKPFLIKERVTIDAVSKLGAALEADLKSLLIYYGETPDSPDSPKPEDFFAMILSFSSSLQVSNWLPFNIAWRLDYVAQKAALEVHDVEEKVQTIKPPVITTVEVEASMMEPVCIVFLTGRKSSNRCQTLNPSRDTQMLAPPSSQGRAAGTITIVHGALDQTIRSMRDGKRRARPGRRPLSKMFIDGGRG